MAGTAAARPVTVRCHVCSTMNRVDIARVRERPRCGECRKPIRFDRPLHVGGEDLEEIIRRATVPVVVDFHADWCGPCRATAPALDDFAGRRAGQVLVMKVDTDRHPDTATRHGVRGIPTLIACEGGREVRRHVGIADLGTLEALVGLR